MDCVQLTYKSVLIRLGIVIMIHYIIHLSLLVDGWGRHTAADVVGGVCMSVFNSSIISRFVDWRRVSRSDVCVIALRAMSVGGSCYSEFIH